MEIPEQETRTRLLVSARKEFLARGFERASLRRICAGAGVTTGAVYFFFRNKEDLFAQIVADTAAQLTRLGQELSRVEMEDPDTGPDCDLAFMELLYRRREEALLLFERSQGTRYAGFAEEMYAQMRCAFTAFFRRYGAENVDTELIRILVEMRMKGNLELLKGDYTMNEVLKLTRLTGLYADGGFRRLTTELQTH